MNAAYYSAGRVCYPDFRSAYKGNFRENRRQCSNWWPGLDIPNPRWVMFGSAEPDGRVRERRVRGAR